MYENLLAHVPTDLWIGGKWRKASDGQRFDVIDPRHRETSSPRWQVPVSTTPRPAVDGRPGCVRGLGRPQAARTRGDPAQGL